MASTVDGLTDWLIEYWWVLLGLFILYIYSKYRNKEAILNLKINEMLLIIETGVFFIIIYYLQKYYFFDHSYFLITIPLFVVIWSVFINYILSKDNVYMIECCFSGEEFHNPDENDTVFSLTTRLRILIMDRGFYEVKKHIGETINPLWNTSRNIKFCNLYHDKSGIFFHSEYPQLQNINFYACVMLWLKLKEDIPKLIRENLVLTFLGDYRTAHQQQILGETFLYRLKGIKEQTDKQPFQMPKTAEDLMEFAKNLQREGSDSANDKTESEGESSNE